MQFALIFNTLAELNTAAGQLGMPSVHPTSPAPAQIATSAPPPPPPPAPPVAAAPPPPPPAPVAAPVAPPAPPAAAPASQYTDPATGHTYTLQHVQTALQTLGNTPNKGGPVAVAAILKKYGLTSLHNIEPSLLPLLYNDAVA